MQEQTTRSIELSFFKKLSELFGKIEQMTGDTNAIDRLKRRVNIARGSLGDRFLLDEARPILMDYADLITNLPKLETADVNQLWAQANISDSDTAFVPELLISVQEKFLSSTPQERSIIHKDLLAILHLCLQHGISLS